MRLARSAQAPRQCSRQARRQCSGQAPRTCSGRASRREQMPKGRVNIIYVLKSSSTASATKRELGTASVLRRQCRRNRQFSLTMEQLEQLQLVKRAAQRRKLLQADEKCCGS